MNDDLNKEKSTTIERRVYCLYHTTRCMCLKLVLEYDIEYLQCTVEFKSIRQSCVTEGT